MEPASCLSIRQIIFTAVLLADFRSLCTMNVVSGMKLSHADIELPGKQLLFQRPESSYIHIASKGRILTVFPGEGSSKQEVEALISFKDSVTTDPSGALNTWSANDSDTCSWTGIKCSKLSNNVADLNLANFGLVGIVPQMIGFLNYLEYVDLSNNFLSGSIPYSISNCSRLLYLNISYNQVRGGIPFHIGKLSYLVTLDATQNNLTGLVPEAICNCSLLETLNLGYNFLEGSIPLMLGQLSTLQLLSLENNFLSGTIPSTLGNCSDLATARLNFNYQLGGELPEELKLLTKMEIFFAHYCNFVGAFPAWAINFTSLIQLDLSTNRFSGQLPEEIGQFSEKLNYLAVYSNAFTGHIPQAVVNCSALVWLGLHDNQMIGSVIPDIGLLRNLEFLTLNNNNFSGVIPPSISNCSGLLTLGVGFNPMSRQIMPSWIPSLANLESIFFPDMNLYGEIPASLGQLSRLVRLNLYSNLLGGVLPSSLGNLSFLSDLDVLANQLQGEIPAEVMGNLSSLAFVQLSANFFVGALPKFSNLRELTSFEMGGNLLTGNIDSNIGMGSPLLTTFMIDFNNFSGYLPDGIGNFSNLESLRLSFNSFSGSIPPMWANLTKLGYFVVEHNNLEGVIPVTIMSCRQLVFLALSGNKLEGPIPHQIGQLVQLEELDLFINFLSGTLPSSLANLTKMGKLDFGNNRFTGVIPGDALLRMASSLVRLDVSHNLISGSLPVEFHALINLQYLDVSANNISGYFMPGLAACIGLAHLDISVNNFTGALPSDLGLLQHLQFFNASGNNFEGPIPTSGLFLTQNVTRSSFLDNPSLCGSTRLVSQKCLGSSVATHHQCRQFQCEKIWIPVAVSIFALLFLGTVIISWWILAPRDTTGQDMITEIVFQGRIVLSEQDLMTIMEGDNIIGMGAKSIVYKGALPGGEIFALKVLRNEGVDSNGDLEKTEELLKEVHILAQLRHVNIIKILGLTVTPDLKALILEYMPRGSLYDHLHSEDEVCQLSHQERFKIILGIAESMVYLHHSFHDPIIHRDLKSSNILLGTDLKPKLGDFGISKFAKLQTQGELEASASAVCGTFGYMPPEYASQSTVSAKGDVYSFGVVVLELLTGRKPATTSAGTSAESGDLVEFVRTTFNVKPFELLDSTLMEEGRVSSSSKDQLMLLLRVGLLCTRVTPRSRPNMNDVLGMLKQIMDVGSETRTQKTVEELANDITIWGTDSTQQPSDQVISLSS